VQAAAVAVAAALFQMSMTAEWSALDSLFTESQKLQDEREHSVPPASYGCDAPVAVKGPTPASIGPPISQSHKKAPKSKPKDAAAIWDADEVAEAGDVDDVDDGRPQPEYDLVYKQRISPEDLFLGIDPIRHPGTACSDEIVLKIKLPGARMADIDLDVRPTFVRMQAPKYKLKAYLPERVDEQRGHAKWDGAKEELVVTLPVVAQIQGKLPTSMSDEID